ncbi:MAG: hypothetical protein HYV93_15145 [Candidatus Rokubacteria bacterium]|nr:hypothetical protein [Candidatus Rokubacteria bacterium]
MTEAMGPFRVWKQTGTHGDVFAAAGLADLLKATDDRVRIRDLGSDFEVETTRRLERAELHRIPQAPGYPFLKTSEKVSVPKGAQDVVDYKIEKAKADRRKQAARAQGATRRRTGEDPQARAQMQEGAVREDWRLLQVLNALGGHKTSNSVHRTIVELKRSAFCDDVTAGLTRLAGDEGAADVEWKVSTVQVFTPIAAKGYSRLKPDSTDRNDKTKEQWADPFVEWLRYRGYFRIACPFFQGAHVRLLCPVPADISIGALGFVARELRKRGVFGGPPKMDALAVLRLAELLIRHSEEYHDEGLEVAPGLFLHTKSPADAVSGIMVTHYQSLGNAKAVSAMSTLVLPGWFPVTSREDAKLWLAILDEHQRVIRGLRDGSRPGEKAHSDEIGLLIAYRRFLEARGDGAMWALLTFVEEYGPFLIRAREQKRKVRSFRTDYLRRVLMGSAGDDVPVMVTAVLGDPGFQAVAAAVRRATVGAQGQKAMGIPDHREIRYDLLHELRRKRSMPGVAPLMETVADFVSRYNSENARRREMGKRRVPRNVTTEEFSGFAALVERHGSPLVGALLCAFGSCREPREGEVAEGGADGGAAEGTGAEGQE